MSTIVGWSQGVDEVSMGVGDAAMLGGRCGIVVPTIDNARNTGFLLCPSEDVLRGLLAAAPDALLAVNAEAEIVFVNDQVERLFGWSSEDLLGRPIECLVPDRFAGRHPSMRAGYVAHPTTRPMGSGLELWARRRDGSEFPAEISLSSFTTAAGTLVAAAIRDVTVARRTKQLLESGPDAIVGVDTSGRIELVNGQAERLFGWAGHDLVGQQLETLVPEVALDSHIEHWASQVADPQARPISAGVQLSARRQDGTTFPAEIRLSAISDEFGPVLMLAAVRDVTDRIEFEADRERQAIAARREQAHRLESLGQLASGIAHDFNNLLGVILNFVTLAARRVTDGTVISDLGEVRAAAEQAAGLTRQLLTFAHRDIVHLEPLEVNDTVRAVASMLKRTLGEHIDLRLDLASGPVVAVADRHQLEQIVVNLAINARDAMPIGGTLTIATERSCADGAMEMASGSVPDVVLRVIDTGHGMSSSVLARAFEPFFTTKPYGEGTGLGLATVYSIANQNGGEVTIDSSVGVGTTVRIVLRGSSETVAEVGPAHEVFTEGGHERILLVEDKTVLRWVTARILRERGYEVLVAFDGIEALDIFDREAGRVDVVVTDMAMPRMRGDELARQLAERNPALAVIFLSDFDPGHAPLIGRLLTKPVAEDELLRAIREALDV